MARLKCLALLILLALSASAWGQSYQRYTSSELDQLLGPVALYPDPLLAEVLPAASYPDQLQAANNVAANNPSAIESQPWDPSVKAVAHYPDVVATMVSNPDWTVALGTAYRNQAEDVMSAVQRLRAQAQAAGNLKSSSQMQVVTSDNYIELVPAQPNYIYVPAYDPSVVYSSAPANWTAPLLTFGAGLAVGSWLNYGCNWGGGYVYNRPWNGAYWGNGYRGGNYTNVNINNSVNRVHFNNTQINNSNRNSINHYNQTNLNNYKGHTSNNINNVNRSNTRVPSYNGSVRTNRPTTLPAQTAPRSGHDLQAPKSTFDGYRNGQETKTFQNRGQSSLNARPNPTVSNPSRSNSGSFNRPSSVSRPSGGARGGGGGRRRMR